MGRQQVAPKPIGTWTVVVSLVVVAIGTITSVRGFTLMTNLQQSRLGRAVSRGRLVIQDGFSYSDIAKQRISGALSMSDDEDNDKIQVQVDSVDDSSFDGKGFANYLAPYALALIASIGVTAAFVKFVLLDY